MTQALRKILLVEDSPIFAARVAELLEGLPDVELAATVARQDEAIALLHHSPIDIILLDLHLNQGTGFGVLRGLVNMPTRPRVIVMTNYALPEYERAAIALGANYFVEKNTVFSRLPDLLHQLWNHDRASVHKP